MAGGKIYAGNAASKFEPAQPFTGSAFGVSIRSSWTKNLSPINGIDGNVCVGPEAELGSPLANAATQLS